MGMPTGQQVVQIIYNNSQSDDPVSSGTGIS